MATRLSLSRKDPLTLALSRQGRGDYGGVPSRKGREGTLPSIKRGLRGVFSPREMSILVSEPRLLLLGREDLVKPDNFHRSPN